MEFKDFENNPQGLIGLPVLYESGVTYSDTRNRYIRMIESVTKTGFRISTKPDKLFSLVDGSQKGLNGKMDMGIVSRCELLTKEQAQSLSDQWKAQKEKKALKNELLPLIENATFEQLTAIKAIFKNES